MLCSHDLLPAPYAWCEVPAGSVTLQFVHLGGGDDRDRTIMPNELVLATYELPAFYISKYPITNEQYRCFIESGGYQNRDWWTEAGWEELTCAHWTEPLYWNDDDWNGPDFPVVGVSWYEALAFCLWLSLSTGEEIGLPTEAQWQRAAQGSENRRFPWGDTWDATRCNNNVGNMGSRKTSPVQKYETLGDSPFGVVDMVGNIHEWCSTKLYAHDSAYESAIGGTALRILKGGTRDGYGSSDLVVTARFSDRPEARDTYGGFRVVKVK